MKTKLSKRIAQALNSITNYDGEEYWKWRLLPSPRKLGLSDSNSLSVRMFTNYAGEITWEDWEEIVKKMYPVRYFLIEELVPKIKSKWTKFVRDPMYWLKCHLLKRHRHHMLDLRQPKVRKDIQPYRYGWIDSDTKLLYAAFNILNTFVQEEMPNLYCPSEEEVESDTNLMSQRHKWLEVKAIHHWWNVERHRQAEIHADMLDRWSEARRKDLPTAHLLWNELHDHEKIQSDKEDEMLGRLMKIRHYLWT